MFLLEWMHSFIERCLAEHLSLFLKKKSLSSSQTNKQVLAIGLRLLFWEYCFVKQIETRDPDFFQGVVKSDRKIYTNFDSLVMKNHEIFRTDIFID